MADRIPSYDELRLRIGRGAEGGYHVVAFGPDGSTASGTLVLPFDDIELDNFVLRVGRPRRGVRGYRSPQMEEAKRFGSKLFDALMTGTIRDVYAGARQAAEQNARGLRVTLYLTDVPALMEVPWEFLYDRPAFLSQSIYTPVVRSLDLKSVRPPRKVTLPLRILGMVSGPRGFETLEVGREQAKLAAALGPLEREGKVELRWLEHATLSALDDAISAPDEVHIMHYIGHGAYDSRTEGGILVLENANGDPNEVTGEELGSLLQDERSLRPVVLNSCEGARGSHVDPFSGVASSLVECGIPAVVGMQFEVTDEAAITFGGRLYGALAQGFPIDAALAQSRKAIFAAGHDIEFGTPVLFLRAADARLFDPELPARPPTGAPVPEAQAPVQAPTDDAKIGDPSMERVLTPGPGVARERGARRKWPRRHPRLTVAAALAAVAAAAAIIVISGGTSHQRPASSPNSQYQALLNLLPATIRSSCSNKEHWMIAPGQARAQASCPRANYDLTYGLWPSASKAQQWVGTARDPGSITCSTSTTNAMKDKLPHATTGCQDKVHGQEKGIDLWWNEDGSPVAASFSWRDREQAAALQQWHQLIQAG